MEEFDYYLVSIEGEVFPCNRNALLAYTSSPFLCSEENVHETIFTSRAVHAFLTIVNGYVPVIDDQETLEELQIMTSFYVSPPSSPNFNLAPEPWSLVS